MASPYERERFSAAELQIKERQDNLLNFHQQSFPRMLQGIQQIPHEEFRQRSLEMRISALEEKIRKLSGIGIGFIKINFLPTKTLNTPLDAIIEPDEEGFIARVTDLPLYGYGEDPKEAIEMLKIEIESLYEDLKEDNEFSDEWLRIKKFLTEIITG